ncbi:MAG: helix-turn-helix domain-containing protein [Armatimonadota bacterium]
MQIDFTTREGRHAQGKLIQQAAEEAGLSLESLAREIGCSRALIYQYVSGATLAQPDRIQQIAERTGKPLLYFYGGESAPEDLLDRILSLQTLLNAQIGPVDLENAVSTAEQLIALARQAGQTKVEATARVRLVSVLLQRSEASRALTALGQTIPFLRQHGLGGPLRASEQNRGHALLALGRIDEAEACFAELAKNDDWTTRWQAKVSLAAVAEYRGQYQRALELLDEALGMAGTAPDTRSAQQLQLYAAGNIANVHLACGDQRAAAAEASRALALAEGLANRDQYIEALLTLGVCQRFDGQLARSRATLETAIRWARLAEDGGREALGRAELAATLIEAGRADDGRELAKDALQQGIATQTRRAELSAQLALAQGYLRADLPQEARYHAAQAMEIGAHLGHPFMQAAALALLGEAYRQRGDAGEARAAFLKARELADAIGTRVPAAQAALGLALTGETVAWPELLAQARELEVPTVRWTVLLHAGIAREEAGAPAEAIPLYREAITTLAALRNSLLGEETGDTYLEQRAAWEPYIRLARALQAQGQAEEAERVIVAAEWPPLAAQPEAVL